MLKNIAIEQVKVQWKHFRPEEATWKMVDQMRAMYPSLFVGKGKEFWYDVWYIFGICFHDVLVYVHMYMDVNIAMSYVIKLHYEIWESCHYNYFVTLLCYHVVMLS